MRHAVFSVLLALTTVAGASAQAPPGLAQCKGAGGYADAGARTFLLRPEWLAAAKARLAANPADVAALAEAARKAMSRGPYSVTDKPSPPPGGAANDYASIGPYWWPDPTRADGLPYVRRDGQVNPERAGEAFDMSRAQRMQDDVQTLALAYALLGDEAHARRASLLIRTWFLDPRTRMAPHLSFAQAVPGKSSGRAEGLIDALRFQSVVESIGLIAPSGALSPDELAALEAWYGDLGDWMLSSPAGKEERASNNNHGVYFDAMVAHFLLFARREDAARDILSGFAEGRLAVQMAADGSFPKEMSRTRSWHYAFWTLDGAATAAMLGECVGENIWSWESSGRSLAVAAAFHASFAATPDAWPRPDIDLKDPARRPREEAAAARILNKLAWGLGDAALSGAARLSAHSSPLEDALLSPTLSADAPR